MGLKAALIAPIASHFYRRTRKNIINKVHNHQVARGILYTPRTLETVIRIGDRKLKKLPHWAYSFPIPEGIGVQFHDLYFRSPLTLAAFKNELDIIERWTDLGLGGACTKTIMPYDRFGNKRPRIQETSINGVDGLINAMGLPGHGVEKKLAELGASPLILKNKPIGLGIGGSSLEEYTRVFDACDKFAACAAVTPFYYEVNISCPNTPEGQQMGKNPALLEELILYMRNRTDKVIGVKLSPDMDDTKLTEFALLVREFGKTYVNIGNTTFRKCEQVGLNHGDISIGGGGYSGPELYPRTKQMVELIAPLHVHIIATGGIDSAKKVLELWAIAKQYDTPILFGMATAVVKDMYCIPRINNGLARAQSL